MLWVSSSVILAKEAVFSIMFHKSDPGTIITAGITTGNQKEVLMKRNSNKWTRGVFSIIALTLIATVQAQAAIIDLSDWKFQDTQTGYTWYDVDYFIGASFNSVDSLLAGSTYHIATTAEITQLFSNFPTDQNIASIIGYTMSDAVNSSTVDWYVSHGFFDNGDPNGVGEAYWSWADWSNLGSGEIYDSGLFDKDSSVDYIGMWIVDSSAAVPEPPAMFLVGLGLIGLAGIRRKQGI
jgi:hypothetical protein